MSEPNEQPERPSPPHTLSSPTARPSRTITADHPDHPHPPTTKHNNGSKKESWGKRIMGRLPVWLSCSMLDLRSWKTFVRCMIATFATMVLMLVQPSLEVLGQAAFFGLIVSQMLPPSLPASIFVFAVLTVVAGMCVGWAWGCAAMAAALQARSQTLLARQVQTAEAGFNPNANIDAQYVQAIFHGEFLDTASSTVYGIFFFFGAYTLGFLRAAKPRLTLGAILGSIILDLMCSIGPLFPIPQYTLARQLLVPAACYLAIALVCMFLFFPQTLHSVVLGATIKACLKPCLAQLQLQDEILTARSGDHERWTVLTTKAYALRDAQIKGVNAVEGQIMLLELEASRGRMGPGDLSKVFEKSRELGLRAYMLSSLAMITEEQHQNIKKRLEEPKSHPEPRFEQHAKLVERYRLEHTSLDDLLPIIESSTAPLRSAAETALVGAIAWLDEVNHTRWRKPKADPPHISARQASLAHVRSALDEFRRSRHFAILEPLRDAFDERGHLKPELVGVYKYSGRDLFRCCVFTTNLVYFALVLIQFLELLLDIEKRNPKAKIQLPTRFGRGLVESANDKTGGGNPLDMGVKDPRQTEVIDDAASEETAVDEDVEKSGKGGKAKKKEKKVWSAQPDAGVPKNAVQKFGRRLAVLWRGLTSASGIFALKFGIVSIALWVPAVCPSSAWFYYTNRGLWALIMAQTGMGVFTGEQIGSFIIRMGGTIFGLVLGMLAWYIGAAKGPGNPYGVAAATMVIIAPFLYLRIVAPMDKMAFWLMIGVTIMFVVGYSWVDEHIYQTANQGAGAALAGRRGLLVLIGFTAAFIVMLFPKPMSAKLLVRRTLAKNISGIADLYGAVVSGVEDEAEVDVGAEWKMNVKERQGRYRAMFLKCLGRMMSLETTMGFAALEPGLQGPWPTARYHELLSIQTQILNAIGVLTGAFARLEPRWCKLLAERSDMMHPAFIADCLALFALLEQALASGTPLPTTMPIFERLAYHHAYRQAQGSRAAQSKSLKVKNGTEKVEGRRFDEKEPDEDLLENEERAVIRGMGDAFNWDTLHEEQFAVLATANVALVHVTSGLNALYRVVVALVGERELAGFDRAQERWGRQEIMAL